jgi:hypothetical protein
MAGSILKKLGRGLALFGAEIRVQLFGKQLKSSTTAPTNGQALVYSSVDDAWSPATVSGGSLPSGTAGLPLVCSGGTTYATTNQVNPLRVGYSGAAALPVEGGIGLARNGSRIAVRSVADTDWVDAFVWDGAANFVYGNTDTTNSGGTILVTPISRDLFIRQGANTFLEIASGGELKVGKSDTVTRYQGGARVPERTLSADTTLDAQDECVFVDATAAAVVLTLPAGTVGRVLTIQRVAGSNNVTINRAGSDTILTGGSAITSWVVSDSARHSLIYRTTSTQWVAEA